MTPKDEAEIAEKAGTGDSPLGSSASECLEFSGEGMLIRDTSADLGRENEAPEADGVGVSAGDNGKEVDRPPNDEGGANIRNKRGR